MAARTGMSQLILDLRARSNAGTSDYTLGSETYFSDDQLQTVLDSQRRDIFAEPLVPVTNLVDGGSAITLDYFFNAQFVEQNTSGTVAWELETTAGSAIGTANYTVEYEANRIRFTADQAGTAYNLTYRRYNLFKATALVLRQKAAQSASRFDVKVDNHDLRLSQLMKNYLTMASVWEIQQGSKTVERVRTDVVWNADI